MPSHSTVRMKIIDFIKDNKLEVGEKLPPEDKLSSKLEVSRLTLREALNMLRGEGFVYTIHGQGTFISSDFKHISDTLNNNLGISEMIRLAGYKPGSKNTTKELVEADDEIEKNLNVIKGSSVLACKRVRTADGKPVVYSIDYIAPQLVSDFLRLPDGDISIYKFVEETQGIMIENSIAEIMPYKCTKALASVLDYKIGEPLLELKQSISDEKGNKLIYGIEYLRPDCFRILVNRRRKK